MIDIKACGSFLEVDSQGYVIKKAHLSLVQNKWKPIIGDIVDYYKEELGAELISVYVRGSVAKGIAEEGLSDIDTFCISENKVDLDQNRKKRLLNLLSNKYPFCAGFEIWGAEEALISQVRKNGKPSIFHELIKTQSICVYGKDHFLELSGLKLQDMSGHLGSLRKNIDEAKEELEGNDDTEDIKDLCTWIMKRIVRSGFELYMEQEQKWTRDLYLCYEVFGKHQPEYSDFMYEALDLAINPVADIGRIADLIDKAPQVLDLA